MKAYLPRDLLAAMFVSISVVPLALLTSGPPPIALGLPLVLFLPGYTLIAALFPREEPLSGVDRLALSFGLSIAIVALIGLGLNYTPWGIRLLPVLLSLVLFNVAMALVACLRRLNLPVASRYQARVRPPFAVLIGWRSERGLEKALSLLLGLAVIGATGTLAYVMATPQVGERFTEFYILGTTGEAEDYPREIYLGQEGVVILGVANNEQEPATYRITVTIDGDRVGEIGPISLGHEEETEQQVAFRPMRPGDHQKVVFFLYRGQESQPYRSLHLWVDVRRLP